MVCVVRGGIASLLGAVLWVGGCGDACEDDGFGGANCVAPPIDQGQSSGAQASSGEEASTSTSGASADGDSSGGSTTSASSGDASDTTGAVGSTLWCTDADGDGFGDPQACEDIPDDETPPPDAVDDDTDCDDASDRTFPGAATEEEGCTKDTDADGWGDANPPRGVDAGTDCLDDDPDTFPGAAELDDANACMRDADDDGYGDAMPPMGGQAGTDCDDADTDVPSVSACLTWCVDADEDEYGDPDACVVDTQPPEGYVGNDADCDDADADAFPGAAPNDDAMACMRDADGDDYGDDTPADASITPGTDCDDLEALVFDACFDCPAGTFYCNADDDAYQCNATGTWGVEVDACGFGCDDATGACWGPLLADAGTCAEVLGGGSAVLTADVSGGDGDYAYAWTPAATLDVTDAVAVTATPTAPTTYAVAVTDGEANAASDQITVHITDQDWDQQAPGCGSHVYADIFETDAPAPNDAFFFGGTARCNFVIDSLPNAYVCPTVIEQAQVAFDLEVINASDNDGIGFVYGWQDASHFYLFSWKQTPEVTPWGTWEQGVTIKRIEADDPADITGEDLGASYDTAHGTILATPSEFLTEGWANLVLYRVTVDLDGPDTTITIANLDAGGAVLASGVITDAAYGPGAVGSYDASQRSTCTDHWRSSCL